MSDELKSAAILDIYPEGDPDSESTFLSGWYPDSVRDLMDKAYERGKKDGARWMAERAIKRLEDAREFEWADEIRALVGEKPE